MIPKINVKYNIISDANNRYKSLKNENSNWWKFVPNDDVERLKRIIKKRESWINELVKFINGKYDSKSIDVNVLNIQSILEEHIEYIVKRLEELTEKPFDYEEINVQCTTFPRCPYNWENWFFWTFILTNKKELILRNSIHEMSHFQFHKYYENNWLVKKLDDNEKYILKESLTFLVNTEFLELELAEDKWYFEHKITRKNMLKYRNENKDKWFLELVNYWCKLIKQ